MQPALERGDGDRRVQERRHGDADRVEPVELEQVLPVAPPGARSRTPRRAPRARASSSPASATPHAVERVEAATCCWPAQPTPMTPTLRSVTGQRLEPARGRVRAAGGRVAQPRRRPLDGVGEHAADVGVVVDGVVLVAGAEVEDPPGAALEAAAAAEHLAARERADEDELVGRAGCRSARRTSPGRDHDRVRDAGGDRVRRRRRSRRARARRRCASAGCTRCRAGAGGPSSSAPECSATRPMPPSTACCTRSTTASSTSSCAMWPHHVSTSVSSSTAWRQAVLRLLQRRGPHLHRVAEQARRSRRRPRRACRRGSARGRRSSCARGRSRSRR